MIKGTPLPPLAPSVQSPTANNLPPPAPSSGGSPTPTPGAGLGLGEAAVFDPTVPVASVVDKHLQRQHQETDMRGEPRLQRGARRPRRLPHPYWSSLTSMRTNNTSSSKRKRTLRITPTRTLTAAGAHYIQQDHPSHGTSSNVHSSSPGVHGHGAAGPVSPPPAFLWRAAASTEQPVAARPWAWERTQSQSKP